ncbi:protein of unknown function [Azospirillum baldaniorum]|uniref:Uncharacterized protein n=1 Tax=Azospirillum baldaniorum TaxID=1064539 RepID=A0A9P1NNH2_9PROT|nr:protein of unknown function [Azospirillum baldaniorum]
MTRLAISSKLMFYFCLNDFECCRVER